MDQVLQSADVEHAVWLVTDALNRLQLSPEVLSEEELDIVHTPGRMVRMWLELTRGVREDPPRVATFKTAHQSMLVLDNIPFVSLCSHHFVPFHGVAHVGYIPNTQLVGISKPARVLDHFAARPQTQELLTRQVADFLDERINPQGVMVVLKAEHTCVTCRGARKPGTKFTTSEVRGVFFSDPSAKAEFLSLVNMKG